MAIDQLTDIETSGLEGTTDPRVGFEYLTLQALNWGPQFLRALDLLSKASFGALRVVPIAGNPDAVGVLPGESYLGTYAGNTSAAGAVDGLADDDVTYIWLHNAGSPQVGSAIDATGWPAYDHIRLAEVTRAGGVITAIKDLRARPALGLVQAAIADMPTSGSSSITAIELQLNAIKGALEDAGILTPAS